MTTPGTVMQTTHVWERRSEWLLTAAALVFLVAYAVPILDPDLDPRPYHVAVTVTWVLFGLDYAGRLWLSRHRWAFVRAHPLDLMVVVLPLLGPLRLVRLVVLLSVLNRVAGRRGLRTRVAVYLPATTALVVAVSALAVLDAERGRTGATIDTYGDAIWWSLTTMATVGYGDHYPVTTGGRLVAIVLFVVGIAVLGTVTATVASLLLDPAAEAEARAQAATRTEVQELTAQVAALREELARRT